MDAPFRLTDEDRRALEGLRPEQGRTRLAGVMMLASVPLLVGVAVVTSRDAWWAAPLVALGVVQIVYFGVRLARAGGGTVARVLAGSRPTSVTGTMSDVGGEDPCPWSLTLDSAIGRARYAYLGSGDPDWLLVEGARIRLHAFGSRLDGIVCLESPDGRRHWTGRLGHGGGERYVSGT